MLTGDRSIAEELVQEAFARVWASPRTPSAEADFRRWLYRAITNLARDYHRRRALESKLRFWAPPEIDPVEEVVHRGEDRDLLRAVLALPLKDRQAIYCVISTASPSPRFPKSWARQNPPPGCASTGR
jgi:RNA polymerase sigma-70 factor (ECF subfamily)